MKDIPKTSFFPNEQECKQTEANLAKIKLLTQN